MLTPDQIAALRDAFGQIADPINDFLLADIARRISQAGQLTSTAQYQIWRSQQLGLSQQEIKQRLRKMLGKSQKEINELLTQAAEVGYRFDLDRLPSSAAIPFEQNMVIQQVVSAAVKLAQDDFTNLTQTLGMVGPDGVALPLQAAYRKCMDYAFEQVFTGAADYNTAIRRATKHLADMGVRVIDYESGVHTGLEAAVRRNMMGGLGLMQEQITQSNHDDLGADGWEISAHAASAPDHEPIQGRQYSDTQYQALNNSLVRRIGTLNCGHAAFPIILGVSSPQYTPEQLRKFREDNEKGVTYQGRHYTMYEATQMQRKVERAIRRQKNRILVDEATGDAEKLTVDQIRLNRLNEEYKLFSKATGLPTQRERIQVAGLGSGQAARASAARKLDAETTRLYELDQTRRTRLEKHPELALPHAERAAIEENKFLRYLFNPDNPRGYAKGVAFTSRLGYDIRSWKELRDEIMNRAKLYPVRQMGDKGHGMTYEQKMILYGRNGKPANVIVAWIDEGGTPRMTSAYIKEVKEHDD